MQTRLYLMLLCCIKIHPLMPILNVSRWSFSVAEGCCRAWAGVTGELRSHNRTTESILRCPPRSSFSGFLHNYLKVITGINGVLSLPRAIPKASSNHSIHTYLSSLLAYVFVNTQQHAQHSTNPTHICTPPTCCPKDLLCLIRLL